MTLHYFRGLNCHLGCMINLACVLGIDYTKAFASLWSETVFGWEEEYRIFTTKRAYTALTALGLELLPSSPEAAAAAEEGTWFFAGMDSRHIPWCKAHHNYGGSHYFIAQKQNAPFAFRCFDPMYQESGLPLHPEDMAAHGFRFSRACRAAAAPPPDTALAQEARNLLDSQPGTQAYLRREIQAFPQTEQPQRLRLIKYVEALLHNRHLFQRYACAALARPLFEPAFFAKWDAVKYGLYKACVLRESESVAEEVSALLMELLGEEVRLAAMLAEGR